MTTTTTRNTKDIKKFCQNKNIELIQSSLLDKYSIVKKEWRTLQKQYDILKEWRLVIETSLKNHTMGLCNYRKKTIFIHIRHLYYDSICECLDTIRHEVAHILTPEDDIDEGHGDIWKAKCCEVGARPVKCGHSNAPSKFLLVCCSSKNDNCYKKKYDRRVKKWLTGYSCPKCNDILKYINNPNWVF